MEGERLFDLDAFSARVLAKMSAEHLSYRQAARLAGVAFATLNRIATAKGPPDVENYLRVSRWLAEPSPVKGAQDGR